MPYDDVPAEDTLRVGLVYGLVGLVDVLHGDGVGELVEHPLLEGLQPLVVVAATHKLLVLQSRGDGGGGEEKKETTRGYTAIWWRRGATADGGREGCYITAS